MNTERSLELASAEILLFSSSKRFAIDSGKLELKMNFWA
jgi:hypothetical protein